MKTAISISDDLYAKAEKYAKRKKLSRSSLYSKAIEEYLKKDEEQKIIDQINKVCEQVDTSLDPAIMEYQRRAIGKSKW
jgi:metal-responsive CopG/Arc/MetJ family transcriptional regulator